MSRSRKEVTVVRERACVATDLTRNMIHSDVISLNASTEKVTVQSDHEQVRSVPIRNIRSIARGN